MLDASFRWSLPLDTAFLGRVDLRQRFAFVEEVTLDVVEQKVLRVRVRQIQAIVVDDLRLLL
jgi:hypothetical protein